MLKKIRYILFIFLSVQIAHSQAYSDNAVLDYKKSSAHLNNYSGPIKSSFWYYSYIIEPIPIASSTDSVVQINARSSLMHQNKDVLGWSVFREFDKNGKLIKKVSMDIDRSYFGKSELNLKTSNINIFDENDWVDKNKIKIKNRQIYPVHDYEIMVQPNIKSQSGNNENVHESKWNYELDLKKRIIKGTNYYSVKSDFSKEKILDKGTIKTIEEKFSKQGNTPYIETEYIYDNLDNVKQLNIRTKQKNPIPFHFLDTETGFCPDLHIAYEYDEKDRMTQVTYYGCKDTLAFEKYVYHPQKEYVTERTRFIKSSMRSVTHKTQTMIFYHNENGDIIEKKHVRLYPTQYLSAGAITLPESIYYKYEYDKYSNWVKCYIYMEGKPEDSEPTAIAQRDLEYYDS